MPVEDAGLYRRERLRDSDYAAARQRLDRELAAGLAGDAFGERLERLLRDDLAPEFAGDLHDAAVGFTRYVSAFLDMGLLDEPTYLCFWLTDDTFLGGHPSMLKGLQAHLDFLPPNRRVEWTVCKAALHLAKQEADRALATAAAIVTGAAGRLSGPSREFAAILEALPAGMIDDDARRALLTCQGRMTHALAALGSGVQGAAPEWQDRLFR